MVAVNHQGGARVHMEDALSPAPLALAVAASVVGTVLTAHLGEDQTGILAGAAILPVITAVFTTRRVGVTGRLRVMAVATLALAALFITIAGFTVQEAATGNSLVTDGPATFIKLESPLGESDSGGVNENPEGDPETTETPSDDTSEIPSQPAETEIPAAYTVQSGDTLHSIAEQFYGDPGLWSIIAEANNLADADSIAVGTQLTIPPHP